jgi:formylglycine-generating enzyme required for sulfatase activity
MYHSIKMASAITVLSVVVAVAQNQLELQSSSEHVTLKPGDVVKDCGGCPELIVVPSGEFVMGSPESEAGRGSDEGPQHRVTISRPFAVGRFSVTFDEWDACVADGGCDGYNPPDGWGRGRQPVINVSLKDAKAYVTWISKKTGKAYRLLSEAEREYVTRAGTATPFWWGTSIAPNQANYNALGSYGGGPKAATYPRKTLPVDSFPPNPWGLYQVHGNVTEWVQDCWHENYNDAPSDGSAWITEECKWQVYRGGAWYFLRLLYALQRVPVICPVLVSL